MSRLPAFTYELQYDKIVTVPGHYPVMMKEI